MKKLSARAAVIFTVLTLSGCGSDLRETLISSAVGDMNKAAGSLSSIKENLEKLDKEKKNEDKVALLKKAAESTNTLRSAALGLQRVKQASLQLEPASKETRDEYREKYQDRLRAAVQRLEKEQKGLNEALIQAEKKHPDQKKELAELKQKLQLAQGEFELQAKQQ
jgi:hypothetical protein